MTVKQLKEIIDSIPEEDDKLPVVLNVNKKGPQKEFNVGWVNLLDEVAVIISQ